LLAGGQGLDYLSFDDAIHGSEVAAAIVEACATGREVSVAGTPSDSQHRRV